MAIAGQIEYKVTVDTSGLKSGLDKSKKEAESFSDKLQKAGLKGANVLGKTLKAGAISATTAIAGITTSAVKNFAEYEQLEGGIVAMFGGLEKGAKQIERVNQLAGDAWKDLTVSQNEYFESFSSAYPLMKADIADQNKAIEQTNKLLSLESDLSNTFGYSMEQASTAINWALKGSFNYLDNLNIGIKGTQEGFLEAAHSVGYMVKDVKELTSEQILDILTKYSDKFGVVGRTGQEAMDTIQGSFKMVKASWGNLVTGIADDTQDFDKLVEDFITSVGALGENILPTIQVALKGVAKLIKQLAPQIISAIPALINELLPVIIEATTGLINALVENLPAILQTIVNAMPMFINAILQIANGILQALPQVLTILVQLIIGIAKAIVQPSNLQLILKAGLTLLVELVKAIPQIIENFALAIPTLIDSIVGFLTEPSSIKMIIKAGVQLFMGLVKAVPQILGALFGAFGTLIGNLWNRLTGLFKAFAGKFGGAIASVFKGAINKVLEFIEGFINAPIDIINGFVDTINGAFGAIGVNIGKIGRINLGRMASGGIVPSTAGGRLILAGEGGQDEWVVPESKMASMIEQINERTGGTGTGNITINVYGTFATSEAEQRRVAEQIYSKLQEINKARMGAYL